jgi:hypothetical protein
MNVAHIYAGSDAQATIALYARLQALGPAGIIAVNLFRAQKASARAKLYHKGKWKRVAYEKKDWSLRLLCEALDEHGDVLGITHGWKLDPLQEFHKWVLYIDLPADFGQCSFHLSERKCHRDYPGDWDGTHTSAQRIVAWVSTLIPSGL